MTAASAIYRGTVVHERLRPKRHRLRYSVFTLLLDLDELADLDVRLRLFTHNGRAPVSFRDRDHGIVGDQALRPWVEARMHDAGLESDGGPIRLLCYPRIFGYVFNPISVFFCHRRDGRLAAILYEVCNTFAERHTYVIPVANDGSAVIRQACAKALHVSPFIGMDATYHFRIVPPGEWVGIVIRLEDADGLLLTASFRGAREPLTDGSLLRALLRLPFLTLKVTAAIHWEAMRLWLKGVPIHRRRPVDVQVQSSVGQIEPQ